MRLYLSGEKGGISEMYDIFILEALAKVLKEKSLSFPRKWESSLFNVLQNLWIPVFTGMTTFARASCMYTYKKLACLCQAKSLIGQIIPLVPAHIKLLRGLLLVRFLCGVLTHQGIQ